MIDYSELKTLDDWKFLVDRELHSGKSVGEIVQAAFKAGQEFNDTEKFILMNENFIAGFNYAFSSLEVASAYDIERLNFIRTVKKKLKEGCE